MGYHAQARYLFLRNGTQEYFLSPLVLSPELIFYHPGLL